MKITVDVDCTPLEARQFMGLPDVEPMQKAAMAEIEKRMMAELQRYSPEALFKAWLPIAGMNADWLQEFLKRAPPKPWRPPPPGVKSSVFVAHVRVLPFQIREAAPTSRTSRENEAILLYGLAGVASGPRPAPKGVTHELREIYRAGARIRTVRAVAGASRGASAIHARARAQGASGRRGGARRRTDRQGWRKFSPSADRGRSGACQIAQGRRVGSRPALYGADDGAPVRQCREDRPEGGRLVRYCRASLAGARDGEGHAGRQDSGQRRRFGADPQRGDQRYPQRPHRRLGLRREPI